MQERVYFSELSGTRVLHVNYAGLREPDELLAVVRRASFVVRGQDPASLLVLVDLTGVPHNLVVAAIMQQGIAESRPHVRARAVIGLAAEAAGSFDVAARLFGSPMQHFADRESAQKWLLGFA